MSEDVRRPGRVREQSVPVEPVAGSRPADTHSERAAGTSESSRSTSEAEIERKPGRVADKATPAEESDSITDSAQGVAIGPERKLGLWQAVFWAFAALAAGYLFFSIFQSIDEALQYSTWLALGLFALTLVFVSLLSVALWREIEAIRKVDRLAERGDLIALAIDRNDQKALLAAIRPALDAIRVDRPELVTQFDEAVRFRSDCEETMNLLSNLVSPELDRAASQATRRAAMATGASVAVIPHPAFDAFVVLWQAIRLIRRIGTIYGLQPTGFSSLLLLRHAVTSAILAAGTEMTGELILQELGRGMAENLGKRAAEAAVVGARIYRLGQLTMALCALDSKGMK